MRIVHASPEHKKPRPTHRPGLSVCLGIWESFVISRGRLPAQATGPVRVLGQRDRVEHAPRSHRARTVDALRPDDAQYVGVLNE